jgi:methionine aminopeptidase
MNQKVKHRVDDAVQPVDCGNKTDHQAIQKARKLAALDIQQLFQKNTKDIRIKMNQKVKHKIPILKSDDDIQFYMKHGPEFGLILKSLEKQIQSGVLTTYENISQTFVSLCVKKWGCDSVRFPFTEVTNSYEEEFPGPVCVSLNDTVAHGLDSNISIGDIVSVDCGVAIKHDKKFMNFDAAFTTQRAKTKERWILTPLIALKTISIVSFQKTIGTAELSCIIEDVAKASALDVVVGVVGHGIGRKLHEPPEIHNARGQYTSIKLINNMCFCVEPIFVLPIEDEDQSNISRIYIDSDGWSLKTLSGQPGSHFETMFCVYKNKLVDLIGISNWIIP